jgi:glutamyl-tRNA reductase
MSDETVNLVTPDDERVFEALRLAERVRTLTDIVHGNAALSSLVVEELKSYNRSWNHPLGFALKS